MHALAQRLADLAAGAEGEPHRPVPRLDNDTALPNQVVLLAADLLATRDAAACGTAADAVIATVRDLA